MTPRKLADENKKMSNGHLPSAALEIVMDDNESTDDYLDEDSNNDTKYTKSVTTDDEDDTIDRRRKPIKLKKQNTHRLIEKRRRDRMNSSLNILLELIPHKKPISQRRIEKTEIIDMAIKHIRRLKSLNQKSFEPFDLNKKSNIKVDAYCSGYHNGLYDIYGYTEKHFRQDQFLPDLICYMKEKEMHLKDLSVVPDRKGKISLSKKSPHATCDPSNTDDSPCVTPDKRTLVDHEDIFDKQKNSNQQIKVPIFVLHPSGTHYIPMSINSSIVAHAFNKESNISQSSSMSEQFPCHPVSIPVNFNPIPALSNADELDIQNINVVGTRHQTSVRPN